MPIPVEKLVIEIGGDAKKFKAELQKLKTGTGDFQKEMENTAAIGKAAFTALGAAAVVLGVQATKAFADYETALTGVAKTADLEGKELEEFSDIIIEMSERIPVTTQALLEISTAAGQLGIKGGENIAIFTEVIAKLGATTDLEGEQAALTIARLINLTGESIKDVDKLGSTLVDLGNNFAATESEILEVAKDVAKATVQFKLSSAEILGISASMASLGIAAEAGGTVVGKAFMAIDQAIRTQGGPAFEKIIELTGLAGDEINQVFAEDAAEVFELFIQGLGKAGAEGKNLTEEMGALGLSGIRVNKILPTLATRSDILADSMERAGIASKDASALNAEAAKAFATSASKLQIAQTKINNTLVALGEQIAPDVIEAIDDIADAVKESTPLMNLFGGIISGTAELVSGLVKVSSSFIDLVQKGWRKTYIDIFGSINSILTLGKKSRKDFERELDTSLINLERKRKKDKEDRITNEKNFIKLKKKLQEDELRNNINELERALSLTSNSKRKINKVVETEEQKRTRIEREAQRKREDQLKISAADKLEIETANLAAIKRANEIDIAIREAEQRNASEEEIQILKDKFAAIKTINDLENAILLTGQKADATEAEKAQAEHNARILEFEQTKFDGIEEKQAAFELASLGSQDDYLTDGIETQQRDHASTLEEIERDKYSDILSEQDDFEADSEKSWGDHLKEIEKETEGFTGFDPLDIGDTSGEVTGINVTTPANCAEAGTDWNPITEMCCTQAQKYDSKLGQCVAKNNTGTSTDTGESDSGESGGGVLDLIDPGKIPTVPEILNPTGDFLDTFTGGFFSRASGNPPPTSGQTPTFSQIGGTGTGTAGQDKMQIEIFLNGSAAEIINAQIKQGVNLGTIITPK